MRLSEAILRCACGGVLVGVIAGAPEFYARVIGIAVVLLVVACATYDQRPASLRSDDQHSKASTQ